MFTSEKLLLVMRPYQIVATERIINKIENATNYKKTGSVDAGGYIWHTTGSGKTLTSFKTDSHVEQDWHKFVKEQQETDFVELISSEKLKEDETRKFLQNSFRDGVIKTTGTDIDKLMPPVSRFGGGNRVEKKQGVIEKLKEFFDKYFGLI